MELHFEYYVVEFLHQPYLNIETYICVPYSWIKANAYGTEDRRVAVAYPAEAWRHTERCVKEKRSPRREWTRYCAVLRFGTDEFKEAKKYIQNKNSTGNKNSKVRKKRGRALRHSNENVTSKTEFLKCQKKELRFTDTRTSLCEYRVKGKETETIKNTLNRKRPTVIRTAKPLNETSDPNKISEKKSELQLISTDNKLKDNVETNCTINNSQIKFASDLQRQLAHSMNEFNQENPQQDLNNSSNYKSHDAPIVKANDIIGTHNMLSSESNLKYPSIVSTPKAISECDESIKQICKEKPDLQNPLLLAHCSLLCNCQNTSCQSECLYENDDKQDSSVYINDTLHKFSCSETLSMDINRAKVKTPICQMNIATEGANVENSVNQEVNPQNKIETMTNHEITYSHKVTKDNLMKGDILYNLPTVINNHPYVDCNLPMEMNLTPQISQILHQSNEQISALKTNTTVLHISNNYEVQDLRKVRIKKFIKVNQIKARHHPSITTNITPTRNQIQSVLPIVEDQTSKISKIYINNQYLPNYNNELKQNEINYKRQGKLDEDGTKSYLHNSNTDNLLKKGTNKMENRLLHFENKQTKKYELLHNNNFNYSNTIHELYTTEKKTSEQANSIKPLEFDQKIQSNNKDYSHDGVICISDDNDDQGETTKHDEVKFTLPPEYEPNNSKWTLKYQNATPEVVELIPGSRVYVSKMALKCCITNAKNYNVLARQLIVEIFSLNALNICSITGAKNNKQERRPALDKSAMLIILDCIEQHGRANGWGPMNVKAVLISLRSKIFEVRSKLGVR